MTTLLHLQASVRGADGHSSMLAQRFVDRWRERHPDGQVVFRDLVGDPIPYLDGPGFGAFTTQEPDRTAGQQAVIAQSDALIAELRDADEIAFAMPMYNFSVPAQIKTYFDYVARAGVTFRYTERGPEGLMEDKPVHLLCARGGLYERFGTDRQMPFLRDYFEMLGLFDLRVVIAEGINIDAELRRQSMDTAFAEIDALFGG